MVDLILFDFSKAFDVVNHSLLLDKLKQLGVGGNLLDWICCFLTGRQMRVSVSGSLSDPKQVKSGVPPGSVLGPILFLVYVNHVPSAISSRFKIFADDLKIYLKIKHKNSYNLVTGISSCQNDIDVSDITVICPMFFLFMPK